MTWQGKIKKFICGCEFSQGFLWTRTCAHHKQMAKSFGDKTTMASILLGKHPHDFDQYEDQLIIVRTAGYVRDSWEGYAEDEQDTSGPPRPDAIQYRDLQQEAYWRKRGLI